MSEKITQLLIDEAAGQFVVDARDHFKKQRENAGYEKEWQLAELSYYNKTSDYYAGLSKVRLPLLHQMVERVVPKMDKTFFPPDIKWLESVPDNPDDEIQKAQAEQAVRLLMDQFRDIQIRKKLIPIYRDLHIYGTVFVKDYWEHCIKERYKRNAENKREKIYDVTYDNPDFYSPSIWDIYADIKDENLEGLVVEKIDKDYQDLWEMREREEDGVRRGIYRNVNKVAGWSNPTDKPSAETRSEGIRGLYGHEFGNHEHKVRIYECWGPIPQWFLTGSVEDKNNKLTCDGLIVVAMSGEHDEHRVVLRISDNPFDHQETPYSRGRYIALSGRLYGLSLVSVNVSLEAYANTLINQDMDTRTFNLRPKWLLDRAGRIDPAALKDQGEQIIETDVMGALEALRPNDFTVSTLSMLGYITQSLEDSTGASKLLSGTPSGGSLDRTAAGVAMVTSGGLERFELVATMFEEEILKRIIRHVWANNQQFLPEGKEFSVLGQGMLRVHPREIPNPRINFIGLRDLAEKNLKINELNILLQNIMPFIPQGIDPTPILMEQIRLMGFGKIIPQIDKRPDSEEMLEETPEGEVQLLRLGRKVRVDLDDDHMAFIAAYRDLLADPNIDAKVEKNTQEAMGKRMLAMELQKRPQLVKELAAKAQEENDY